MCCRRIWQLIATVSLCVIIPNSWVIWPLFMVWMWKSCLITNLLRPPSAIGDTKGHTTGEHCVIDLGSQLPWLLIMGAWVAMSAYSRYFKRLMHVPVRHSYAVFKWRNRNIMGVIICVCDCLCVIMCRYNLDTYINACEQDIAGMKRDTVGFPY